jgi:hypothetical protein
MNKYLEEIEFLKNKMFLINQEILNIKESYKQENLKYKQINSDRNNLKRINQSADDAIKLAKLYHDKNIKLEDYLMHQILHLLCELIIMLVMVFNIPLLLIPTFLVIIFHDLPFIKNIIKNYRLGKKELQEIAKIFKHLPIVDENHLNIKASHLKDKINQIMQNNNKQEQQILNSNANLINQMTRRDTAIEKLVTEKNNISARIGKIKALIINQNPNMEFSSEEYLDDNREFDKRLKLELQRSSYEPISSN